jgi:cyclic-di-GMP phosphodiesterase TipF (flagellum assembly factor)
VPASFLLAEPATTGADIHAADLSDLLGRFGISLIAERIEAEAQVVDLLEYDVRFGQGFLFSQPRPVRAEALRGSADGADEPLREEQTARRVAAGGSGAAF